MSTHTWPGVKLTAFNISRLLRLQSTNVIFVPQQCFQSPPAGIQKTILYISCAFTDNHNTHHSRIIEKPSQFRDLIIKSPWCCRLGAWSGPWPKVEGQKKQVYQSILWLNEAKLISKRKRGPGRKKKKKSRQTTSSTLQWHFQEPGGEGRAFEGKSRDECGIRTEPR